MNTPCKPSRIDFSAVSVREIETVLRGGDLGFLSEANRRYFELMEMVRGLRARMTLPGGDRLVTKAGIIRLLKSQPYGLTDWMARRVYADSLNFFYSEEGVATKAWANLYAERLEKWADMEAVSGNRKDAGKLLTEAAKLRGCYKEQEQEIPEELLSMRPVVVYTGDAEALGAPKADRNELEKIIDSIPDMPDAARARVKEDAGINKRNLLQRMMEDAKEYGEEE